jgi:hypothetical protein
MPTLIASKTFTTNFSGENWNSAATIFSVYYFLCNCYSSNFGTLRILNHSVVKSDILISKVLLVLSRSHHVEL